jgi:CheY-like chemotaxis protein
MNCAHSSFFQKHYFALCDLTNLKFGICFRNNTTNLMIMKILVVHRQSKTVDRIKSVLSSCNPVVLHTESGLDGLLTSRIEHFDVIICGTDLPVVTGFEMIRSVRTNSINRQTPVIILSDEIDERTTLLGQALDVMAMIPSKDIDGRLSDLVAQQVKVMPDKKWNELTPISKI